MAGEPEKKVAEEVKPKSRLELLEEQVAALTAMTEELKKRPFAKRQLFGGKTERNPVKDTKTGKIYISKSGVGKALAAEFGLDPADKFVWYKIRSQAPERFVDATEEESAKVVAEYEAEVAANLAKAEAESAATAAAEAKKTGTAAPAIPAPAKGAKKTGK